SDNILWVAVDGYIPPTETDLLKKAAMKIIAKYVSSDALLAANIYKIQAETAIKLDKASVKIGNWYHVPRWDTLKENLNWWLRGLRVATNQAIVGVKADLVYIDKLIEKYKTIVDESLSAAFSAKDSSDPYPNFNEVISILYYYSRVLDVCRDNKNTYSNPTGWEFWRHIKLSKDVVCAAMSGNDLTEDIKESWATFLLGLNSEKMTRGGVLKSHPKLIVPMIDIEKYIERSCFSDRYGAKFLARTKAKWWTAYYTEPKSKKSTRQQMLNKDSFKPYYLFVICGLDLPSQEFMAEFPKQLLTPKGFALAREELYDGHKLSIMEYMLSGFLSFGKNAIALYMTSMKDGDVRAKKAGFYKEFLDANAKLAMVTELKLHARRDGRIHSLIAPLTRTGRDTSSAPNLQNLNMSVMCGVLIGDDGRVLVELDLSNAENVMAAMISNDDILAAATEEGDFHIKMAMIYFKKELKTADAARRKELRGVGKSITFGNAYGMGVFSMQIRLREEGVHFSSDQLKKMIRDKDSAYPKVIRKKRQIVSEAKKRCSSRYGYKPPYLPLWSKERVQIPYDESGTDVQYQNGWNYAQQGGVSTIVRRSMIETQEWLEDENYDTRIALNIHDSHIPNCVEEEADIVLPKNAEFMGSQVPEEFCRRTTPMVHFVSAVGPENAKKWGYVDGKEYPLSLDKFYNQWGVHQMPEGEDEAPTWRGPIHEGWTLAKETKAIKTGVSLDGLWEGQVGLDTNKIMESQKKDEEPSIKHIKMAIRGLASLEKGYTLSLPALNGGENAKMKIPYPELSTTLCKLSAKGHHLPVQAAVEDIKEVCHLLDLSAQALLNKKIVLEALYEQLPNQQKSVDDNIVGESSGDEKQENLGEEEGRIPLPSQQ
ncbi:MAG: hypothetical protein KAS32_16015, partial [Candidatus Peribacteraceae bacterium]|nr:hypothetical protein [Candidatus Peribacteraceae bacterium]